MLDIKFIRENARLVQKGSKDKGVDVDVQKVLGFDKEYREVQIQVQALREEKNKFNSQIKGKPSQEQVEKGKEVKKELDGKEQKLKELETKLKELLLQIPNLPKEDVKAGKDESENEIVKKWGEPTKFTFKAKGHLELGEALDIIDVQRASKVSGSRFYYLKNQGALLEFALHQFAFETLIKEGFTPVIPPVLIKKDIMKALGYMEHGGEDDMFTLSKDDLVLVGTSEQSIVPMHKDEILNSKHLPKRYVGFSSCFRREAGSYGKDTKGILRAHQFDKVEMVSYVVQGQDDKEHEYLLSIEEKFLQALGIPYQVVKMCTGDLGFPVSRKYDIEGWIPSQNKYRELTSASTTTDFQARRLNIKYREGGVVHFTNILNGTAFSTRPIIAILENYQKEDGSVIVPEVLRKYLSFNEIKVKKNS